MAKGSIKARIQCTIEVPVGTWGGGQTDLDQLGEQVRKEGLHILQRIMEKENGAIIGHPRVVFLLLSEDR